MLEKIALQSQVQSRHRDCNTCLNKHRQKWKLFSTIYKGVMFAVRNQIINIENNFPNKDTIAICECGVKEDMRHIYNCELLSDNKQKQSLAYNNIFNGNLKQKTMVYKIFKHNLEKENK
jgi:hypothetical protein